MKYQVTLQGEFRLMVDVPSEGEAVHAAVEILKDFKNDSGNAAESSKRTNPS